MKSHVVNIARQIYSMPPAHGGILVADILSTPALSASWRRELEAMRLAVAGNRRLLVKTAREHQLGGRLDYIEGQYGMFSLLPVDERQVLALRERHGIYVAQTGAPISAASTREMSAIYAKRLPTCFLNKQPYTVFCLAARWLIFIFFRPRPPLST